MKCTRDEIIAVANSIATGQEHALCPAFREVWKPKVEIKVMVARMEVVFSSSSRAYSAYEIVPAYLRALGGRPLWDGPLWDGVSDWYWPDSKEGREQRLVFLAFMLAWHSDIMKAKREKRNVG